MTEGMHPNLSLLGELNLADLNSCKSIIADDFVWHYYNSHLPELNGDHFGIDGWKSFFAKLGKKSNRTFRQKLIDGRAAGDELVVTQVCNTMALEGRSFEVDAVVVWRIVNGKIAEAWDIPAVNTVRPVDQH